MRASKPGPGRDRRRGLRRGLDMTPLRRLRSGGPGAEPPQASAPRPTPRVIPRRRRPPAAPPPSVVSGAGPAAGRVAQVRAVALRREAAGARPAVPAPQVPLELPGDRLAGRLRQVRGVPRLLQRLDVLGHLAVLRGELVDAELPGAGVLGEFTERDAQVDEVLKAVEQGEGGLRVGWLRDVVRDRRPEADRRNSRVRTGLLEDAHDARRALVAGLLQVHRAGEIRIRGHAAHRYRPGVRGVAEQRAEDDHHLDAQLMGEPEDLVAERAPAHRRFDTAHQDQIARLVAADADHGEPGGGPCDLADPAVQPHRRPVDLEVVVVLRVERGEDFALPYPVQVRDRGGGGVARVVPALERGDHDRVDQLGNALQLDHPVPPSEVPCVRPNLTASVIPSRSPRARLAESGGDEPTAVEAARTDGDSSDLSDENYRRTLESGAQPAIYIG